MEKMKSRLMITILVSLIFMLGCSEHNNLILTPKYDNKSNKYGYVNQNGRVVIPYRYVSASDFSEGLATVKGNDGWGFIDKEGNEVIPFIYDYCSDFYEGLAFVEIDKKWGCIDIAGHEIVPLEYQSPEMIFIWQKLLTPHLKQITEYQSKLNKSARSTGVFRIKQPYIHLIAHRDEYKDIYLRSYSDNYVNKYDTVSNYLSDYDMPPPPPENPKYMHHFMQFVDSVKTVIIEHNFDDFVNEYTRLGSVTSIGSYLVYFDIESKKCIGFDIIRGPTLPDNISFYDNSRSIESAKDQVNHPDVITDKIKTRLAATK